MGYSKDYTGAFHVNYRLLSLPPKKRVSGEPASRQDLDGEEDGAGS
jgi:hypothetical protein